MRNLNLSVGGQDMRTARNREVSWSEFTSMFDKPRVSDISLEEYEALPKGKKSAYKTEAGWYVGGYIENSHRITANIKKRDFITLDFDNLTPRAFKSLKDGSNPLPWWTYNLYTTRSHSAENPKARVNIPLTRSINADEYVALSRILASFSDPMMAMVDEASFRAAQFMYFPTISTGQEYISCINVGEEWVDPDDVFSDWPHDIQDFASLPRAAHSSIPRGTGGLAQDPTVKDNVVGQFCRTYDINEVIHKFLPDIYAPGTGTGGKDRYTYIKGSGVNGAVVEQDGLFLYSFHGTDPASNRLLNAFDLVRVHKFEHLDEKIPPETPTLSLPSYKEMINFAKNDSEVRNSILNEKTEKIQELQNLLGVEDSEDSGDDETHIEDMWFDDSVGNLPQNPEEVNLAVAENALPERYWGSGLPEANPKWFQDLELAKDGRIRGSMHNAILILQNDPRLRGSLSYNVMSGDIVRTKAIDSKMDSVGVRGLQDESFGDLFTDSDENMIRAILSAQDTKGLGYGFSGNESVITGAIDHVARQKPFHPFYDMISKTEWDGVPRVENFWNEYCKCGDDEYTRQVSTLTFVAAIARIFFPGCKFDYMTVLTGGQGARKSTLIGEMGYDRWTRNFSAKLHLGAESAMNMAGCLFMEVGELQGMKRSDIEGVKDFLSAKVDRIRLPYGRRYIDLPRQSIFIGTTNQNTFLKDTENRRFWPIKVATDDIDIDKFKRNRDQIWAEALVLFGKMYQENCENGRFTGRLPLYLTDEAERIAKRLQSQRKVQSYDDEIRSKVLAFLSDPIIETDFDGNVTGRWERTATCVAEIHQQVFEGSTSNDIGRNNMLYQLIGETIASRGEWIPYMNKTGTDTRLRFGDLGRCPAFVKRDASEDDIKEKRRAAL